MNKKIKLLLINVLNHQLNSPYPALNLIMLADYLIKHNGILEKNIKIINTFYYEPLRIISVFKPDIVGCSVMTPSYDTAIELGKQIKKISSAYLIMGGYHISGLPEQLNYPFDIGIIGEGEQPLLEIIQLYRRTHSLKEKHLKKIMNVVYRSKNDKVIVNPMRPLLKPADIPILKSSLLTKERYIQYIPIIKEGIPQLARSANIFTARGCPYNCKFCSAQIIWPKKFGLRMFPAKRVGYEIEYLFKEHNINSIHIWDDTFAVTKNRLRELIQELINRNLLDKITFNHVYVRANLVDKEFVELLKQFGTVSVFIGFESGSNPILGYLKNNSLTVEQIRKAINLFSKAKIEVLGSFMLFSPGETIKDLNQSYSLANWLVSRRNVSITPCITVPYPGTELWNVAVRNNIIDIKTIKWNRFAIYIFKVKDLYVFFSNKLSHEIQIKYWLKFQALWRKGKKIKASIHGYRKIQLLAKKYNIEIDKQIRRKLIYGETNIRFYRFISHPFASISNIMKDPKKLKLIITQSVMLLIPKIDIEQHT